MIRSGTSAALLYLFINLEYRDAGEWKYLSHPGSPFALAAQDNVLYAAGLRSGSVGDAQRFFELSREELAEFSCVCGGRITNDEMADRVERHRRPQRPIRGAIPLHPSRIGSIRGSLPISEAKCTGVCEDKQTKLGKCANISQTKPDALVSAGANFLVRYS